MIPAKYTVVLKSLLDDPNAKAAIDRALSTYPLYKPEKAYDLIPPREEINKKLLNHYKYREIFCSAPGRFIDELEITMCEIMPRYNELLKTVAIMADIEDPFGNLDVVETFEQERSDTATAQGTTTSTQENTGKQTISTQANTTVDDTESRNEHNTGTAKGKNIEADTPQGTIITENDISGVTKGSMAKWNQDTTQTDLEADVTKSSETTNTGSETTESEASVSSEGSSNLSNQATGTTRHTLTRKGNQGVNTYAHDMNEFRTSIIDVIDQVINDPRIQELFFMLH